MNSKLEKKIYTLADSMGYEIVRILQLPANSRKSATRLQVMAEPKDHSIMTITGCEELSRAIAPMLEVEDPIKEAYDLEVSSPGIDRPLTRLQDFERFQGHLAKIETRLPQQGESEQTQSRFRSVIQGVDKDNIVIENGVIIPFENIKTAKLVMTDELLAAHQPDSTENLAKS